ncbi:MAG: LPS export ABC transporter ATP-binding protein [Deltaproteobacteria bacterium]|nr:MAG: LPS export ABC transporter ATP-binding protein [Deltaproteobacteria bacterium]
MASNRLFAQQLSKSFRGRKVVDEVDLEVRAGEVVGLLGPNGAGKTTTFYMMVGLIKSDHGKIFLDGQEITSYPMYQRARMGLNYLPQDSSVFRKLTVEENLLAILETLDLSEQERRERLTKLLQEMGIAHLEKTKAYCLSGGERRRVEISRALVTNPSFILLDEPFTGIDPLAVTDIQALIMQLVSRGIGVLISDHNVRETLGVCNRAYILSQGQIIEEGDREKIAQSPRARRIYLGENFSLK